MGPRIKAAGQGTHRPVVMVTEADFATTYFRILTPEVRWRRSAESRPQVKYGADHIKYVVTGGVLSLTATGTEQQFTDEEQIALVQLPTWVAKWRSCAR